MLINPKDNLPDPTSFPLAAGVHKDRGPFLGELSPLPWYYPNALENVRHLRWNLYLPTSHDKHAWSTTFPAKLARFVIGTKNGRALRSLKILIGTWYTLLDFSTSQAAVFDVLEQMQVRGTVEIRTKNIYNLTKVAIRDLDLEHRLRDQGPTRSRPGNIERPGGSHLDWEWEGGKSLPEKPDLEGYMQRLHLEEPQGS